MTSPAAAHRGDLGAKPVTRTIALIVLFGLSASLLAAGGAASLAQIGQAPDPTVLDGDTLIPVGVMMAGLVALTSMSWRVGRAVGGHEEKERHLQLRLQKLEQSRTDLEHRLVRLEQAAR